MRNKEIFRRVSPYALLNQSDHSKKQNDDASRVRKMGEGKIELVAPCGMNCGVCSAYLAYSKNIPKQKGKIVHCIGCRPRNKKCAYLKGHCDKLSSHQIEFCFECEEFPCDRLKHIDQRYRKRYNTSLIDNLQKN